MTTDIAAARTFLFVPGDRPGRFGKAAASGADVGPGHPRQGGSESGPGSERPPFGTKELFYRLLSSMLS